MNKAMLVPGLLVSVCLACGKSQTETTSDSSTVMPQGSAAPRPVVPTGVLSARSNEECTIAKFCATTPCTYDELMALVRRGERCSKGEAGTCGAFPYIEFEAYDGGYEVYFDAKGNALGARSWSDMANARGCRNYGEVPRCDKKPTVRLCGQPRQ